MKERDTLFTQRRSVRRFGNQILENDKLTEILEAARWAPTWGNTQCTELIVVQGDALKVQLAETLSKKNPATLCMQKAPVVIAVCGALKKSGYYSGVPLTKFGDWFMFDLGIISQNICLAAHAIGIGTVIVGAFEHDKVKELLAVPEGYEVVSLIPMGYPAHEPPAPPRKSLEEFVHQERFNR